MASTNALVQQAAILRSMQPSNTALKVGFIGGGSLALLYFGKKWYDKYLEEQENKKVIEGDPNAELALRFKSSIDTGLLKWISTNDTDIINLVKQAGTDWKEVVKSYKKQTGGDLLNDVQKAMRDSNFQIVLNMIGIKTGTKKPTSQQAQEVAKKIV